MINPASQVNEFGLYPTCSRTSIKILNQGLNILIFKDHIFDKSVKERLERGVTEGYYESWH